ncbi:MAG TPA: hypothetical protein VKB30_05230 [Candidatus Limnocylindrales bacterium]|nr:hypothetical protein [Candidatus Limnocylindrales bacterium]
MGEGSDTARAQVLAAREALGDELERLEASARTAVDVPAKVRRNPGRAAGVAAGAGFLLVGGPQKVFRRAKRVVLGPTEPLPKSMLPKEIDKALGKLGDDGDKVRGTLEREFSSYLEQTAPQRRERDLGAVGAILLSALIRPLVQRYGKQLIDQLFSTDTAQFEEQLAKVRARAKADGAAVDPAVVEPPADAPGATETP